jgi:hypothetical protein
MDSLLFKYGSLWEEAFKRRVVFNQREFNRYVNCYREYIRLINKNWDLVYNRHKKVYSLVNKEDPSLTGPQAGNEWKKVIIDTYRGSSRNRNDWGDPSFFQETRHGPRDHHKK